MENPASWGRAEHVVSEAFERWWVAEEEMRFGFSLARTVTDALRAEGLLKED